MKRSLILFLSVCCIAFSVQAQEDEFDDFDISQFEEAGSTLKAFCTNKVLGQSPSPLLSFAYDFQGPSDITTGINEGFQEETGEVQYNSGFRFNGNFPIVSRNNILINLGVNYVQHGYSFTTEDMASPFLRSIQERSLKWFNTNLTIFKPLNEKRFILAQIGAELNGDYNFGDFQSLSTVRIPAALIYGFKPDDNLMWGPGVSRTYLGGSLNILPVVYYYQTFDNDKWGIEALFPARIQGRYRFNSRNVLLMGYQVEGATYRIGQFNDFPGAAALNVNDNIELRRSEIRAGLTYTRGLNDFIWVGVQGGYRLNYEFNLDEGEFFRGFDSEDYFIENELTNALYLQVSLSLVSP